MKKKAKKILETPDERMLALMKHALETGKFATERDFLKTIKFSHTNISNIRCGHQKFNRHHIQEACRATGVSADWILGLDNKMSKKEPESSIDRIKVAVVALEMEINGLKKIRGQL